MFGKSEIAVDTVDSILTNLLDIDYLYDNKRYFALMMADVGMSTASRLPHLAVPQKSLRKSSTVSTGVPA